MNKGTVSDDSEKENTEGSAKPLKKEIDFLTPIEETSDVFERDYDLHTLGLHVTEEFVTSFQEGIAFYLAGDWAEAKKVLEKTNSMFQTGTYGHLLNGDGPSKTLLKYMAERQFDL